jgi:hypothetical protein
MRVKKEGPKLRMLIRNPCAIPLNMGVSQNISDCKIARKNGYPKYDRVFDCKSLYTPGAAATICLPNR